MLKLPQYIRDQHTFRKFEVDELLFVEYKCLIEETESGYWTPTNYFAFVTEGKKQWMTGNSEYVVKANEAIFIKKGAYIARNITSDDFCALIVFVPDDFIQSVMNTHATGFTASYSESGLEDKILPIPMDQGLHAYVYSMLSYFSKDVTTSVELIKLKLEELILNLLSNPRNYAFRSYFKYLQEHSKVSIRQIMEHNYMYNMSISEYAALCARSLSAFRADFVEIYNTTPGKWLIKKRLEYAKLLLVSSSKSVNEVAFESGFRNISHFIRVFRTTYGDSPTKYRIRENIGV